MGWKRKSPPERYRPYTPDELAEMRRLAEAGLSRARIAEKIGRSTGSVSGVCYIHGIKTCGGPGPQTARPPDFKAKVARLAAEGYSQRRIAEALGVSPNTVSMYCSRHGIRTAGYKRIEPARVEPVRRLAVRGLSRRDIAEELNVPLTWINDVCSDFGISTRRGKRGRIPRVQIKPLSPVETTAEENV